MTMILKFGPFEMKCEMGSIPDGSALHRGGWEGKEEPSDALIWWFTSRIPDSAVFYARVAIECGGLIQPPESISVADSAHYILGPFGPDTVLKRKTVVAVARNLAGAGSLFDRTKPSINPRATPP